MSIKYAAIGVAKCPTTDKIYGVRLEERDNNKLFATWAFPIKPEVAQREGYSESEFPPSIHYDNNYPGCPYCNKREDLHEISKHLAKKEIVIMVGGSSNYDDLGSVLTSINIAWKPLGDLKDCDVLFLNCLGSSPNYTDLRKFVEGGGCVFGSCTQSSLLELAFPESIGFEDIGFKTGIETVTIEDSDLRDFIGKQRIDVNFHVAGGGNPNNGNFKTILKSCGKVFDNGTNICVRATCGKGTIFFTMFHNSDNMNEQETALLQLLVLKEIGGSRNRSLDEIGSDFGIDMDKIKARFKSNW
ncbi:hypothetical protein AGMMS49975_16500 [Clostridia bacterium]|nr:hypothetical protein AGMMS49975_16360 [Clostridia bacterium]GHU55128.1 hypothetical protein AGMMS49975_16500 [Clostridia bacterium]